MSGVAIGIAALKASASVTAVVTSSRIYAIEAPQGAQAPYLLVHLIHEGDEQILSGAGAYAQSRVTVECVAPTAAGAIELGEKVKAALQDVTKASIGGRSDVDIYKEGTDTTGLSDDRSQKIRLIDFYIRWR